MKRFTYVLQNKLFIALTDRTVSRSLIALRGPSFHFPPTANIFPLTSEPNADDIFRVVDAAFDDGTINVDSMESEDITFAGAGEPLLKLDVMTEAASMILESRHGAQLRLNTTGLVPSKDSAKVTFLGLVMIA